MARVALHAGRAPSRPNLARQTDLLHQARAHGLEVVYIQSVVGERYPRGGQDRVEGQGRRALFGQGRAVRGDEEAASGEGQMSATRAVQPTGSEPGKEQQPTFFG